MFARRACAIATRASGSQRCASSLLPGSWILRAREAKDASVLLGRFQSAGCFDSCLDGMECTSIGDDSVSLELIVSQNLANNIGTLHGGAISTIVDVVGTMALLSRDATRAGVSVEMSQCFVAAARVGERLELTGRVLGYGGSLGYTEITIHALRDGRKHLCATGRHTKFMRVN